MVVDTAYARTAAIAAAQEGHIAAWQCRLAGVSISWVQDRVARHGWARVHRGVYRIGGVPPSPRGDLWGALLAVSDLHGLDRAERWLEQGRPVVGAAVMAVREVGQVTAWSLAYLIGARSVPTAVPQILVDPDVQVRGRLVCTVRGGVDPAATVLIGGLPCAPPHRMLYDGAWIGRRSKGIDRSLHDLVIHLDRTRRFAVDDLISLVEEPLLLGLPFRVPSALRRAAELLRPGFSHSHTEAVAREAAQEEADRHGVELTSRPHPIRADGRIIAEADIAAIALRWDLEVDGPHHRALSVQRRDRDRDARLATLVDWSVSRYGHTLIDEDLSAYRRRVRTDLEARIDAVEAT